MIEWTTLISIYCVRYRTWQRSGHAATLYTVVQTWGSAPRQPGSMRALRDDGVVIGFVSCGCIEDDLIRRQANGAQRLDQGAVKLIAYGMSREEAARFGLPCGGTLQLTEELVSDIAWVDSLVERCSRQ